MGSQQDVDPRAPLSQFFESDPRIALRWLLPDPDPWTGLESFVACPPSLLALAATSPVPDTLAFAQFQNIPYLPITVFETRDLASGPTRLLVVNGGTGVTSEVIRGSREVVGHLLGAEPVPSTCEQQPWAVTVTSLPATQAEKTALASPGSGTGVFPDGLDEGRVGRLWGQEKPRGPCSEIEDLTGRPQSIQPRGALGPAPRDCMGFMP